jgi:hypothetical protein
VRCFNASWFFCTWLQKWLHSAKSYVNSHHTVVNIKNIIWYNRYLTNLQKIDSRRKSFIKKIKVIYRLYVSIFIRVRYVIWIVLKFYFICINTLFHILKIFFRWYVSDIGCLIDRLISIRSYFMPTVSLHRSRFETIVKQRNANDPWFSNMRTEVTFHFQYQYRSRSRIHIALGLRLRNSGLTSYLWYINSLQSQDKFKNVLFNYSIF